MKSSLLKYQIGLCAVGLVTIGLIALVVAQADATKQDTATDKAANNIADKLNTFIDTNGTVPSSLAEAGVSSAPSSVRYQKLNDSSYKFCVMYRTKSSGFDATGAVESVVTGGAVDTSGSDFTDGTDLFIPDTHHKGANCQTIKPVGLQDNSSQLNSSGINQSAPTTLCGYSPSTYAGCKIRCASATQTTALSVTDDMVSSVTTAGGTTTLHVTDTKGTRHTVTTTPNTVLYDSSCQTITASDLVQYDRIRVIVAGQTVKATQGAQVMASEIDDFSL